MASTNNLRINSYSPSKKTAKKLIINGEGTGDVIKLKSDKITIENFQITSSGTDYGKTGIRIDSDHNTITNNNITQNNDDGIVLAGSSNTDSKNNISNNLDGIHESGSNNKIINNHITKNDVNGIKLGVVHISVSESVTIKGNTISQNRKGIEIDTSRDKVIKGNDISENN